MSDTIIFDARLVFLIKSYFYIYIHMLFVCCLKLLAFHKWRSNSEASCWHRDLLRAKSGFASTQMAVAPSCAAIAKLHWCLVTKVAPSICLSTQATAASHPVCAPAAGKSSQNIVCQQCLQGSSTVRPGLPAVWFLTALQFRAGTEPQPVRQPAMTAPDASWRCSQERETHSQHCMARSKRRGVVQIYLRRGRWRELKREKRDRWPKVWSDSQAVK